MQKNEGIYVLRHFHAPSWWGLAEGMLLGIGIAVFAELSVPFFIIAVVSTGIVGIVIGHSMEELLDTHELNVRAVGNHTLIPASENESELSEHLLLHEKLVQDEQAKAQLLLKKKTIISTSVILSKQSVVKRPLHIISYNKSAKAARH